MAKKNFELFKLVCPEDKSFYFVKKKNPKKTAGQEKFKFRKYHPGLKKHVWFFEKKHNS